MFRSKLNAYWLCFLALISGALLACSFAPLAWYPLAFCLPAILYALCAKVRAKHAIYLGIWFGMGFFGVGASWVYISIHQFGGTSAPLAVLFTLLFILILALFFGGCTGLLRRFFQLNQTVTAVIVFPSLWVLFEALRGWFLTGFPWLFLGYSQISGPLAGFVPLVGVFGTSWICLWLSGLLYLLFIRPWRQKVMSLLLIILTMTGGWSLSHINWTQPQGRPLNVHLVQGNIAQEVKWSPDFLQNTLRRYWQLTQPIKNSDLIVWPESAVPIPKHRIQPLLARMDAWGKKRQTSIMLGLPILNQKTERYLNGMMLLGWGKGEYYKRHLVPFGEYLPFESLRGLINFFNIPMSNFEAGPQRQRLLATKRARIAAFICYEIAYANTLYHELPAAELLVVASDDSWFGHSWAQAQHLQIAQARALQVGREVLFSTNNGITAIIDAKGQIKTQIPAFSADVLAGQARIYHGTTPWIWLGNRILLLGMFLIIILILWIQGKRKKHGI